MVQRSYSILDEAKTLFAELEYDEHNNLVSRITHYPAPKTTSKYTYDNQNRLILELDLDDGNEVSRVAYTYNEEGDLLEQLTYFADSLYERIIFTKTESGSVKQTFQDGEEVERYELKNDGQNWQSRFYSNKVLLAEHEYIYDASKRMGIKRINDIEYDFKIKIFSLLDENDHLLKYQEFKNETNLMYEATYTYENGNLKRLEVNDHAYDLGEHVYEYEYDQNGNRVSYSCKSSTGFLYAFHNRIYNDKNQVIEDYGMNHSSFVGIDDSSVIPGKFHLIHEYED